tara:strand:- start:874 stop:1746 length:873 start_codon:yes stop_codon:yes gene_type:complete
LKNKRKNKILFLCLTILVLLVLCSRINKKDNSDQEKIVFNKEKLEDIETIKDLELPEIDKNISYFYHYHSWENYYGTKFSGIFKVPKKFFKSSKFNRENPEIYTHFELTEQLVYYFLYKNVLSFDEDKLEEITLMFEEIKKKKRLNRVQFAELIVSSIQAIPYVLISHVPCNECEFYDPSIECMGNVFAGFQSPVEFMSNFKGDCDTRALLCFSILQNFGYDVAVLISQVYQHAVLGINLNVGGGDYLKYKGKRYYAWETTSEGWKAGNLPPEVSKMYYWNINITNDDLK